MAVELLSRGIELESLRDGTTVLLETPTTEDLDRLLRYFRALPKSERKYLRFDVTQREVVERLIREAVEGKAYRILASVDDEVVGHGALEISTDAWQSHIGEIRAIVAPGFRRRGLGALLIKALFRAAEAHDVEKVVVRLQGPQVGVRTACERLGFAVEAVLEDHVKDADGEIQDLVVMSYALDEVSRALREYNMGEDRHALD